MHDFKLAFRQLIKTPGFTLVAVVMLALGIGANTTVFSVARSLLFRPLSFDAADQLVWIRSSDVTTGAIDERISQREFEHVRESAQSLDVFAALGSAYAVWEHEEQVEVAAAINVTPELADVLRIRPALGRMLLPSDTQSGAEPVVMISHELWHDRFGGRPDIIGQTIRVNQTAHAIVGVLPAGLEFPLERAPVVGTGDNIRPGTQNFWFPLQLHDEDPTSQNTPAYLAIGRLAADAPQESANAELALLMQRFARDPTSTGGHRRLETIGLREQILGRTSAGIPILAAAVAAVLLICCVNLANLLLARGITRQRELAVRAALGASRQRLLRMVLLETMLLALLGGTLALVLTEGALHVLRLWAPANVPFIREVELDHLALVFTGVVALLAALAAGLLPALRQVSTASRAVLAGGVRLTTEPRIRRWQQGLVVAQIAVVLTLLACAGLLLESFRRLMNQNLGYQPRSVVAIDFDAWNPDGNSDGFHRAIKDRLAVLPGVEAVGAIQSTPLTGRWTFEEKVRVVGGARPLDEGPTLAGTFVAFDYFRAMSIPLVAGRTFREAELARDEYLPVVMLNEAAARQLFPGESVIGRRIAFRFTPEQSYEVIGVVRDTRDVRLEEAPPPRFYLSAAFGGAQFLVRTSTSVETMVPLLRETLRQFGSRIVVREIQPLQSIVAATVAERRFLMALMTVYAAIALGVAVLGIFSVVAYQVAQRTHEFGIRLALGSSPHGLLRLVLLQAGRFTSIGLVIGLVATAAASRLLESQLFGLSPHDPFLLGTVCALVLLIALAASFLPARRAARVDPVEALRSE